LRSHFGLPTAYAVGEAVHYRRLSDVRLGEVAPAVIAAAVDGDAVARQLVERLANEIVLMVRRALTDLGVEAADIVLGGGMLATDDGLLRELVVGGLPAGANAVVPDAPPVAGAVLAALDAVGATEDAKRRVHEELRAR
jgi:N-acetylglucosamine kinase-like BadF-type ATPase